MSQSAKIENGNKAIDMLSADFQSQLCALDPNDTDFLVSGLRLCADLDTTMLRSRRAFVARLSRLMLDIDRHLSKQLDTLLLHPEFKALEATWRGVEALVSLPVNYQKIHVKLLDLSWEALSHEFNTAVSLRRTHLYNLIANRELNTAGGQPFGLLVVDHDISMNLDGDYDDLYTLELLAKFGDLCLCPLILSPADDFFGEVGADWLSDTARVEKIIHGPDYVAWQRLRRLPTARFLGLTLPKVRLREAYKVTDSQRIMYQASHTDGTLWGSAAFLFASIAMREFNRINWFGFMKSRWQDQYAGALVNLPPASQGAFATRHPKPSIRLITDMGVFYAAQGFIPLCHSWTTEKYFFRGNDSIWQTGKDETESVMGQIQTTLMICRIAHYLKVQIRSMIGNFQTAEECENYLNAWLEQYASNLFNADEATLAKYPLSKGRVTVRAIDGQQGRYTCDVLVQPQYQYDNVCGEVLLSTDLGPEQQGAYMAAGG